MASALEASKAFRAASGHALLREFRDLLAIPNHAGDGENIAGNVAFIAEAFRRRGVTIDILESPGAAPVVRGVLRVPGATRTLGFYAHYDGQPVTPEDWTSPPFEPALRDVNGTVVDFDGPIDDDCRISARSVADDKAPIAALLGALDALREADISPTSNLVLLFEGEEEIGSPNLGSYLEQFRGAADAWLICDGPVHQSRRPQLIFGVRGLAEFELTVYGPAVGLHSGHYGNWAPNPAMRLAQLLASMKDARGNVLIDGFDDDVVPLTEADRAALETIPDVDAALRDDLAIGASEGAPASLCERLLLPSLNVRGLASAAVGAQVSNVIPPTATASIDIRLVADCDPARMLDRVEAHLRTQGCHVVHDEPSASIRRAHETVVHMRRGPGYRAVRTPMDVPIVAPLVRAAREAAGDEIILMPSLGGTLPLYLFEDVLGAPLVIVPIANHDNNQHAADENLRIGNLWYGVDLFASILTAGQVHP